MMDRKQSQCDEQNRLVNEWKFVGLRLLGPLELGVWCSPKNKATYNLCYIQCIISIDNAIIFTQAAVPHLTCIFMCSPDASTVDEDGIWKRASFPIIVGRTGV